jgi:hypothetical protein
LESRERDVTDQLARWLKPEIEGAFDALVEAGDRSFLTGDFTPWLACFTDDVVYSERGNGIAGWNRRATGIAEVRQWIENLRSQHLQQHVLFRPVPWRIVDVGRGWVVCEWRNRMRDPGDGSIHEARAYGRLFYAGGGKWRFVEEIYNSTARHMVMAAWQDARRSAEAAGKALPAPDKAWARDSAIPTSPPIVPGRARRSSPP